MDGAEINIDFKKEVPSLNSELDEQAKASIDFSVRVIEALSCKAKDHNQKSIKKVSTAQLKKVYVRGASSKSGAEKTSGEWALARVNMFLRLISNNAFKVVSDKNNQEFLAPISEIDVTESWIPSEEDFGQASIDIVNFRLNYDFGDVNDLYLHDSEQKSSRFWFDF